MTKLQLLNAYLTERLMVAVREILEVVGGTVFEYQEETARAKREIESLRRRLREAGVDGNGWLESAQCVALPLSGGTSPIEQQYCEQDWGSSQGQDPGTMLSEEGGELSEPCRTKERENLYDLSEPMSPQLKSPSRCVKNDNDLDSNEPSDVFKIQIVGTLKVDSETSVSELIKTEPNGSSWNTSEQPAPSKSINAETLDRKKTQEGEHANNIGCVPVSQPETPKSQGNLREVKAKRSHSCPQCGKTFSHVSRLKIHLRIHTGEKPYSCAQCGKCFNNDGTLKNHQRVHTEVRLYSCTQCGMSFKDAYTCKKHQRVHTGEKPYCCTLCGKQFNGLGNLQTHIRTHTGERPYCCTVCGKCFTESGKLNKHFKIHTRENTYS